MLGALLALALAQCGPEGPIYSCPNTMGPSTPCTDVCACTTPRCSDHPGVECGTVDAGCGIALDCGTCDADAGSVCVSGVCTGCAPTTCVAQGKDCGSIGDACDGVLDCGTCTAPLICGGDPNTTMNVCGQPDPFLLKLATASEQTAMGSECSCASSVTIGSGGEVVTNVQDGGSWCTSGDWLNGIAIGAMSLCPSDTVRVMSGDGTLKGVLSEYDHHNYFSSASIDRSMAIDFTDWLTAASGGAGLCTCSPPDAGLCPDGTMSATRCTCPSVSAGQYTQFYHDSECQNGSGAKMSGGCYWMGYAADGGLDMNFGGGGVVRRGFRGDSYTRGLNENFTDDNAYVGFGLLPDYVGVSSEPALDVLICGCGCWTDNHAPSYFQTGNHNGDRLVATALVPTDSDLRIQSDVYTEGPGSAPSGSYLVTVGADFSTGSFIGAQSFSTGMLCNRVWSAVADNVLETGTTFSENTTNSLICLWDGTLDSTGQLVSCLGASCQDAGISNVAQGSQFGPGIEIDLGVKQDNAGWKSQPDAIIRNVRISSTARKMISTFGDSIVEERGIPQLVMRGELGNAVSVYNYGVSGWNVDQCATAWEGVLAQVRAAPSEANRNYLLIQCGTNSLGVDAGYIADTLRGLLTDARDAGAHPIWSTIIPRDDHCAAVQTLNATMRGWCIDAGIPYVETWANLLADRSNPCSGLIGAYQRDSVHLNDAGTTAMVELWVYGNDGGTWGGFKSPRRGPHWHHRPVLAWSPRTGTGGRQ